MNTKQCLVAMIMGIATAGAAAQTMSSANYSIKWSSVNGGGDMMTSTNYIVNDSVAQQTPLGDTSSANYALTGGFWAAPDSDADQVRDFMDNCTFDLNTSQYDSNGDGYGNLCDPDLDNNGAVNFIDYAMLTSAFLSTPGAPNWNADADLTGDNVVNFIDISLFQFFFLQAPGPSGIAP